MFGLSFLHCRRIRLMLWDYVDERLAEGPMETVEHHMTSCLRCRQEVEGMRQAHSLLVACRQAPVPQPHTQWHTLRSDLLQTPAPPAPVRRQPQYLHAVVSAGVTALLIMTGYGYVGRRHPGAPPALPVRPKVALPVAVAHTAASDETVRSEAAPITVSFVLPSNIISILTPSENTSSQARQAETHANPASVQSKVAAADPGRKTAPKLARQDDKTPRFHPYSIRPEDRIQQADGQDTSEVDHSADTVGNETSNGGYVMPPLRPEPRDDETPY